MHTSVEGANDTAVLVSRSIHDAAVSSEGPCPTSSADSGFSARISPHNSSLSPSGPNAAQGTQSPLNPTWLATTPAVATARG